MFWVYFPSKKYFKPVKTLFNFGLVPKICIKCMTLLYPHFKSKIFGVVQKLRLCCRNLQVWVFGETHKNSMENTLKINQSQQWNPLKMAESALWYVEYNLFCISSDVFSFYQADYTSADKEMMGYILKLYRFIHRKKA